MVSPLISGVFAYSQSGLPLRIKSFLPTHEGREKKGKQLNSEFVGIIKKVSTGLSDCGGGPVTTFNYASRGVRWEAKAYQQHDEGI